MAAVPINSATTNYFDYSVSYDYSTRQVTINDTSSYVGGGAASVDPIAFVITTPTLITSSGTITPSAPVALVKNMGLLGNTIVVGTYTVTGTFTDADDSVYTLTKTTNLCLPYQDATASGANGTVTLGWTVRCIDNLIIVADQTSFVLTVNSTVLTASSKTYGITCVNPLGVVIADDRNIPQFQITPIVNGSYAITIDDDATFTVGDSVTVTVHFKLTGATKKAQCNINLCDVYCAVDSVYIAWKAVKGTGSNTERELYSKWTQLSLLIGLAQVAISCGNDLDTILTQIEAISGVSCQCGCGITNVDQGVNVALGQNIVVQSDGGDITVNSTTVGNTTTFGISDITYVVEIGAGSAAYLTVTDDTVGDTTTFTIEFDLAELKTALGNIVLFNDQTAYPLTNIGQFNSYAISAGEIENNGDQVVIDTFFYSSASVADSPTVAIQLNGVSVWTYVFASGILGVKVQFIINRVSASSSRVTAESIPYAAPVSTIFPGASPYSVFIIPTTLAVDFTSALTVSTRFTVDSATAITMTNAGLTIKYFRLQT